MNYAKASGLLAAVTAPQDERRKPASTLVITITNHGALTSGSSK